MKVLVPGNTFLLLFLGGQLVRLVSGAAAAASFTISFAPTFAINPAAPSHRDGLQRAKGSIATPKNSLTTGTATFSIATTTTTTTTNKKPKATTTTQLKSIPNPFDTLTSGLASMCRLPRGITVADACLEDDTDGTAITEEEYENMDWEAENIGPMPRFLQLYDIENDMFCRQVRERLTELDVVVEAVIPAAKGSRIFADSNSFQVGNPYALEPGSLIPRLVVEEDGSGVRTLHGAPQIVAYLDGIQDLRERRANSRKKNIKIALKEDHEEEEQMGDLPLQLQKFTQVAENIWNVAGNALASFLRLGRGTAVSSSANSNNKAVPRPPKPLVLYSYEGNQFCRLVREVLTELDLVYELRNCGKKSPRRSELAYITGGKTQCPYLIDPNTGVDMAESADIVAYLYKTYALWTPPNEVLQWASTSVLPWTAPLFQALAPLQAGSNREDTTAYRRELEKAQKEIEQAIVQHPVVVYTYDWSPFSSETVALLDRLEVPYRSISLGKEWLPGLIDSEKGVMTRAALLERAGQSSLPHIFVGGKSIGGLFSGTPGLVPALEQGEFLNQVKAAVKATSSKEAVVKVDVADLQPPGINQTLVDAFE